MAPTWRHQFIHKRFNEYELSKFDYSRMKKLFWCDFEISESRADVHIQVLNFKTTGTKSMC